ncbi:hypothetical protein CDCA_CDCA10G3024 [Cyanidium caldarium]|uniref:BAR domain-containing protein n=1 Tax=Cyanidium caldarium TaxID=2771 RepID=A0AAV9IXK8_CYACA|nr:hypothetical protein CDCA_CDCA10G3024 [Cyanidium caldarium]
MSARKIFFTGAKLGVRLRERLHIEDVYEDDSELRLELLSLKEVRRANETLAKWYRKHNAALSATVDSGRSCSEALIDVARLLRVRGDVINEEELSQEPGDKYLFSRELREVLVTVGRTERDVHDALSAFSRAVELNMIKPRESFVAEYDKGEFRKKKLHYKDVKRTFKAHQRSEVEELGAVERFELAEARAAHEDAESQLRRYAEQMEVENDEHMKQTIASFVIQHHAALARAAIALERILPLCRTYAVERGASVNTTLVTVSAEASGGSASTDAGQRQQRRRALLVARVWWLAWRLASAQRRAQRMPPDSSMTISRAASDADRSQSLVALDEALQRERLDTRRLSAELHKAQRVARLFIGLCWRAMARRARTVPDAYARAEPPPPASAHASRQPWLWFQNAALRLIVRQQRERLSQDSQISQLVQTDVMRDLLRCQEDLLQLRALFDAERRKRLAIWRQVRRQQHKPFAIVRLNPLRRGTGRYIGPLLHASDKHWQPGTPVPSVVPIDCGTVRLPQQEREIELDHVMHSAMPQRELYEALYQALRASTSPSPKRLLFIAAEPDANAYSALGTASAPGALRGLIHAYFQRGHYVPLAIGGAEYHSIGAAVGALERLLRDHPCRVVSLQPAFTPTGVAVNGEEQDDALVAPSFEPMPLEVHFVSGDPPFAELDRLRELPLACCVATVSDDARGAAIVQLVQQLADLTPPPPAALDTSLETVDGLGDASPARFTFNADATTIVEDDTYAFNESSSLMRSYLLS